MTVAVSSPAISRWQEATIERILPQTQRVSSVFLRTTLGPHDAGQHVDVRLTAPDGYEAQRSYSIASAPGAVSIELAIECLQDGEVSPYFHDVARAGDTVDVRGPIGGHFVWRTGDGGPLLLVGGGSGIVPLIAIARHRALRSPATIALLVYSARTWDELVFRDELLKLQARDTNFSVVITTTRGPSHRVDDFDRRLDRSLLRGILTKWAHRPASVYVCGSNAFVETVTSGLVLEDTAPERIRTERFGGTG